MGPDGRPDFELGKPAVRLNYETDRLCIRLGRLGGVLNDEPGLNPAPANGDRNGDLVCYTVLGTSRKSEFRLVAIYRVDSCRQLRACPLGIGMTIQKIRPGTNWAFAERLRRFRLENQLSADELAQKVGAESHTVRRWEAGTSRPSRELADRLSQVGLGHIPDNETNASSRSRIKSGICSTVAKPGGYECKFVLPQFPHATFPSWIANGPPDQDEFYLELLKLQLDSAVAPERLSLLDCFEEGQKTSQSQLEAPKTTAASWNSNYGSHGWHRYVGRFPPHLVRALLNHFGANSSSVVCDPFSGSGTTAVECRLLGIPFVGIEISALSHLMGSVKAGFDPDPDVLRKLADDYEFFFKERAAAFFCNHPDSFTVADVLSREANPVPSFSNIEKWFTPRAFLGVSVTVEFARAQKGYRREALLLALSAKMRSIGNVDVDVVRAEYSKKPRENVDVSKLVTRHLRKMAKDVSEMARSHSASIGAPNSIRLVEGSALSIELLIESLDFIITSPPYGVEALSYLRTHLLSYRSLQSELNHDPYEVRDQTIGSEYLEEADLSIRLSVEAVSPTFRSFFSDQSDQTDRKMRRRRAGMMKFFEDIYQVGIKMSKWLKDGGRVAWVIGNKRLGERVIPTDKIIQEAFASCDLKLYKVIRHKLKTNNSNSQVPWQERIIQEEAIMLFERMHRG